jgi:hypothetical protein
MEQLLLAERKAREMLEHGGIAPPDSIQYREDDIVLLWHEKKVAVVVDCPPPPPPPPPLAS